MGSTCRAQNLYGQMLVAKIWLDNPEDTTSIKSEDLFPYSDDLLYETLKKTKPSLKELY